jgi:ATP-dependent Clp protease ATP-binding subunit ClpA
MLPKLVDSFSNEVEKMLSLIIERDNLYFEYIKHGVDEDIKKKRPPEEPKWRQDTKKAERERITKVIQNRIKAVNDAKMPIYIDKTQLLEEMQKTIVGQTEQLEKLALATKLHLCKISPTKPAICFLFGPSGVGKTESVNALESALNRISKVNFNLIRVDCGLLSESHRGVSSLTGSPPGYRNSGEKNILSPILDNPRCIILWDECEKMSGAVWDLLLSTLDYGKIQLASPIGGDKDANGNVINGKEGSLFLDARYCVFCFSSNLQLDSPTKSIGFSDDSAPSDLISNDDRYKQSLIDNGFRPELAGRISYFLNYQPLSDEEIRKIISLEFYHAAKAFGLFVEEVADSVIDDVVKATSSKHGMRAYRSIIEKYCGELFAEYMASEDIYNVLIEGNLESIKIIPSSKPEVPVDFCDDILF